VVAQGEVRFVFTAGLKGKSEIAQHAARHGDGVHAIALAVPDADEAYRVALERGAVGVEEPHELSDEHGTVRLASIATYGETIHRFVDRSHYSGPFLPGYVAVDGGDDLELFTQFDHLVGNVELGRMNEWV